MYYNQKVSFSLYVWFNVLHIVLHQLPLYLTSLSTIVSYISSYKKCTIKYNLVITCVSLPLNTEQCLYKNTIKSVFVPIIVLHVMPPSWLPLSQNNLRICWWVDNMYLLTFLFNMLQMTPFIDMIKIVLRTAKIYNKKEIVSIIVVTQPYIQCHSKLDNIFIYLCSALLI